MGGAANVGGFELDYLRIQKDGRLNVDAKYTHVDALTEADRGIVDATRGGIAPSGDVPVVSPIIAR